MWCHFWWDYDVQDKSEITEIVGVQEKEFVEIGDIDGRDVIVPERLEQHRDVAQTLDSDESNISHPGNLESVVITPPKG